MLVCIRVVQKSQLEQYVPVKCGLHAMRYNRFKLVETGFTEDGYYGPP